TSIPDSTYNIVDFYNEIVIYEERFEDIIGAIPMETNVFASQKISNLSLLSSSSENENTTTITREEILSAYNKSSSDRVYEDYLEQLLTTQLFVVSIRELIDNQDNIRLFEPFHPNNDESITYEFVLSDEGYILIDALYDTQHHYLKIGLNSDKLEYQEFSYYYSSQSLNPKDDLDINFNLFKFTENEDAVYIRYTNQNSTLRYTSIEHDEQFTISYGSNLIEGSEYEEIGYVLNMYDRALNAQTYLQVVNNEIVGETYDIFDEHGQVYRYDDYDSNDEVIRLQVNFVTATGWDYVVASDTSDEEIDQMTGIFLDDGTKIYDNWFNYTYTPTYGHLGLWIEIADKEQLTNHLFSLNQYGMNLDNSKATVEFFNQVDLDDFEQIKSRFRIDNLDFFSEDLHYELYNYIDQDIRNNLEGTYDEPIITTGDIDSFNNTISMFQSNLQESPQYTGHNNMTISFLDSNNTVVSESSIISYINFDQTAMFYREYSSTIGANFHDSFTYIIDGTKGKLIEYEINDTTARYDILAEEATQANFLEAYNCLSVGSDLNGIYEITKINDTTFELKVDSSFLNNSSVDLNILFEQEGISGLDNQEIIVTFEFTEDYDGYDVSFIISGLTKDSFGIRITSESITTIETFDIVSPQDQTFLNFYLPQSIDDILFTTTLSSGRYILDSGTSYMKLFLEPGEYSVDVYGDYYNPQVIIMDESMNELDSNQHFLATYEGYYYVEIISTSRQSADIYVRSNPSPQFYHFVLEETDDNFEATVNIGGISSGDITVPSFSEDRLLTIYPYYVTEPIDDELIELSVGLNDIQYNYFCFLDPNQLGPCYFYLPADIELVIEIRHVFNGTFGFDYEYSTIPSGAFDNTYSWDDFSIYPQLWLTEESPVAHVDFTITEARGYELNAIYKDFGYSYQKAALYSSDGTQISSNWFYTLMLEPGDYYIEFIGDYPDYLQVLILPEMIIH
ncbi:MAG: hypothetical protein KAU02_03815, partial [Tenericutes bacterium]|nr:hypothetical protein [Mycoplasmatota bacterium]